MAWPETKATAGQPGGPDDAAAIEPVIEGGAEDVAAGPMHDGTRWWKLGFLLVLAGGMVLGHYLTPTGERTAFLHDIYRRILYLPVILAAFWFGWRGGLICAAAIGLAYFPHIHHDWGGRFFDMNLNRTLEVTMYLIVGGITGGLIDRLRLSNARLAGQSRRLQQTMTALREKTREVFEAEEQLRQADRLTALGQLSAGLAHEIRNPLGSIRGTAEILGDADVGEAQRAEFSRILIEETERLDKVLSNFLEYAKAQRFGQEGPTELGPVVERLLTLLAKRLDSARIEVEVDLEAEALAPVIAEGPLQQVLLNVMLNAVQAMEEGGRLRIESRAIELRNPEGVLSAGLLIGVSDTGPGIPRAIRGRIFDPFFTTKAGGTGLGLAIVHKIVTGHGGRIYLDEKYEAGTRVRIELPGE